MSLKNHFVVALVFLSGLATMACEQGEEGADEAGMGTLEVALTAQSPSGDRYVLRNAVFEVVQNYSEYEEYQPYLELSTEDDPYSLLLSARVLPGDYMVTLRDGWYIAKVSENGKEEDIEVNAVKLTDSTQWVWVNQWWPAQVVYQFGINGELIDFVGADLQIGIQILEPDSGAGPWPFPPEYDGGPYVDTDTFWDTEYDGGPYMDIDDIIWDTGYDIYLDTEYETADTGCQN
jgi:hypothetical protein